MCRKIQFAAAVVAFLAALWVPCPLLAGESDHCAVCGGPLGDWVYTYTDKVTGEKVQVCSACAKLPDTCFMCGLPVAKEITRLPDGRVLCARDVKTAVLDDAEAKRICTETIDDLNRLLSRFVSFPVTNVDIAVVDRVNLMGLFNSPGNDHECPNILGYTQSSTNGGWVHHSISLMSALTESQLRAVSAHELGHAWVYENVSSGRWKSLGRDAHEGFSELVAYLLMESRQDDVQKAAILKNTYTRGQIFNFIDAEERYSFNDVVDWMKYGVDPLLDHDDPTKVRRVKMPVNRPLSAALFDFHPLPEPPSPSALVLNGITSSPNQPTALINGRTFAVGEEGRVRVGGTNATIRCLGIAAESVRLEVLANGEEQVLRLRDADAR